MSAVQCPKCEIRFQFRQELEHHCRVDHPEFHHEYRANPTPRHRAVDVAPDQAPEPDSPPLRPAHRR